MRLSISNYSTGYFDCAFLFYVQQKPSKPVHEILVFIALSSNEGSYTQSLDADEVRFTLKL